MIHAKRFCGQVRECPVTHAVLICHTSIFRIEAACCISETKHCDDTYLSSVDLTGEKHTMSHNNVPISSTHSVSCKSMVYCLGAFTLHLSKIHLGADQMILRKCRLFCSHDVSPSAATTPMSSFSCRPLR